MSFRADDFMSRTPARGGLPEFTSAARVEQIPRAGEITAEIAGAWRLTNLGPAWADLLKRADVPNVFMDPDLVCSAVQTYPDARIAALLAWRSVGPSRQLTGVWAFAAGHARRSPLPLDVLNTPLLPYWYLATPVIDRTNLDGTLNAMLDCIANEPGLPKIIALDSMSEGVTMAALARVLEARQSPPVVFERFNRPRLESTLDGKKYLERALSGSSRKKLRQYRRRLSDKGALTSVIASEPDAVRSALEEFLAMEASGWKGRQGSALLCSERDAAFIRAGVMALAEQGRASLHSVRLDGTPVSMQLVVRAGSAAFTWKTAYDERFHDFSPGMLLLEDYTEALLADERITVVDSCSHDDSGFMSAWTERQTVADLWIDARRGGSLEFYLCGHLQKTYRKLRAIAKAAYLKRRRSGK
jgi:CelD/BcsL family acetyltransferase involved in cellulose biosynthesis